MTDAWLDTVDQALATVLDEHMQMFANSRGRRNCIVGFARQVIGLGPLLKASRTFLEAVRQNGQPPSEQPGA